MSKQILKPERRNHAGWLLATIAAFGLTVPLAANADHRYDRYNGAEFLLGALIGYAINDTHYRDRNLYYHAHDHHRGWRDCRRRSHFAVARYYNRGHYRSRYYNDHYYDDRYYKSRYKSRYHDKRRRGYHRRHNDNHHGQRRRHHRHH